MAVTYRLEDARIHTLTDGSSLPVRLGNPRGGFLRARR